MPRDDVKKSVTVTTVAKPVGDGEARLPSGDDGSSWTGADDTNCLVDVTVAKAVGEAPSTVSRQRWSRVDECNSALPSLLRIRLNLLKKASRR